MSARQAIGPDVAHEARLMRLAKIRQRVRELHSLVMLMDPLDRDHCALFNRLHCSVWDMASGPEVPYVRHLFKAMPSRSDEQRAAINRRIFELRELFVKPVLRQAAGDMPEAAVINLFSQSQQEPFYV